MANLSFCNKEQLAIISSLAQEIWPSVYDYMISPAQIKYMLEKMYTNSALEKQFHQGHQFIILENIEPIGFASYELYAGEGMKLHKLYLKKKEHGKGWGKMLLDKVIEEGRKNKKLWIELNVNRENRSISFYQSQGFTIQQTVDIAIGDGFEMNDFIMTKYLD